MLACSSYLADSTQAVPWSSQGSMATQLHEGVRKPFKRQTPAHLHSPLLLLLLLFTFSVSLQSLPSLDLPLCNKLVNVLSIVHLQPSGFSSNF